MARTSKESSSSGMQLGIQGVHMGTFSISCGLQWFLNFQLSTWFLVVSITPMASPTQKNTNKTTGHKKTYLEAQSFALRNDPHIYKSDLQLMGGWKEFQS